MKDEYTAVKGNGKAERKKNKILLDETDPFGLIVVVLKVGVAFAQQ